VRRCGEFLLTLLHLPDRAPGASQLACVCFPLYSSGPRSFSLAGGGVDGLIIGWQKERKASLVVSIKPGTSDIGDGHAIAFFAPRLS